MMLNVQFVSSGFSSGATALLPGSWWRRQSCSSRLDLDRVVM
jgi:hypothetical protein